MKPTNKPSLKALAAALAAALWLWPAAGAKAGEFILFDVNTGDVLAQDNAAHRWYPASLTKLMTAYIAFSAIKSGKLTLDSPVRISAEAARQPPSHMGWKPGTRVSLDNALKIMLVKSANDIAVAVGEAAGGVPYADAMNAAAADLGMSGSHFVNANGIHSPQHYTTARDLAVLVRALRTDFPDLSSYFGIEAIQYGDHVERNYNILLGRFAGADGMKTGFVCASGFNLIGTATRNGRTLGAVVLGEKSQVARAERAADLLTKGFAMTSAPIATLDTLKAPAGAAEPAPDMRKQVCTEAAAADRWDGREIDGKVTFNTPNLRIMERAPVTVKVGMLAAAAADGWPLTVPVPVARPDRPSGAAPVADAALRPALPAPAKKKF